MSPRPSPIAAGQDPLARYKVAGLRNLKDLAIVVRADSPDQAAAMKQWGDLAEVQLHRDLPEMEVTNTERASAWLVLSVSKIESGFQIEVSLFRWVRLQEAKEAIFTKVWWSGEGGCGHVSDDDLKRVLDKSLRSFVADYVRSRK